MLMFKPLAAAMVANIVEGTFGFLEDKAMRRLLMELGIGPGELGICNELASKAAAELALLSILPLLDCELVSAEDEDTLYLLDVVTVSRVSSK